MTLEVAALAGVIGALVGSFLNVVIYRLPRGESVVTPRSHCPHCATPIRPIDNVPIVSWLWLRGRCRRCREPISARYPLVELVSAVLAAGLAVRLGPGIAAVAAFYFAASLLALTYIDLDVQLLPDRLTLPGIAVGLLVAFVAPPGDRLVAPQAAIVGTLLGGGMLWLVAWAYHAITGREGMGGGDVKLLAMIGAFLGWQGVLLTLLLASFIGSAIGIALMIQKRADSKLAIPFGPFLAMGALVALFWGPQIVRWYISSLGMTTI